MAITHDVVTVCMGQKFSKAKPLDIGDQSYTSTDVSQAVDTATFADKVTIQSSALSRAMRAIERFATKPKEIDAKQFGECNFGKDMAGDDIKCTPIKAFKNKLNGVFFQVDCDTFSKVFRRAREAQKNRGQCLADRTPEEFSRMGAICYVNSSGSGGVTVKATSEEGRVHIGAACNLPQGAPGRQYMGRTLLSVVALSGANTCCCLEPLLQRYKKYGWTPVAEMSVRKDASFDWRENEPDVALYSLVKIPGSYSHDQVPHPVKCESETEFNEVTINAFRHMYQERQASDSHLRKRVGGQHPDEQAQPSLFRSDEQLTIGRFSLTRNQLPDLSGVTRPRADPSQRDRYS
jgi:hypothetical protein